MLMSARAKVMFKSALPPRKSGILWASSFALVLPSAFTSVEFASAEAAATECIFRNLNTDRADTWQHAQPVIQNNEQEKGGYERNKIRPDLPNSIGCQVLKHLVHHLEDVLDAGG